MPDAIAALELMSEQVTALGNAITTGRRRSVPASLAQPLARSIATTYFESVRSELLAAQSRSPLVDEIDFVVQALLQLASASRERQAYVGQLNELKPYLLEATIDLLRARGSPRLVLSDTERAILSTLGNMLPMSAASYEQALLDLSQGSRVSWRGTATELREVLREVIDQLAPDQAVVAMPGFHLEENQTKPTQRQKVRFILRARRSTSAAITVAETSLVTVDEAVAALARSTYTRSAVSTHARTNIAEVRNLKRYVDALLGELLEIA
jgi:hypothetical protein